VEPASSLLKMDADKAAAQSFHNAGKGRNGGTNHDYLATEGRHQGLLALDGVFVCVCVFLRVCMCV